MILKDFTRCSITTLKKHVDANHSIIVKKIEEEVEILITKNVERKLVTKKPNVLANIIFIILL